VPPTMRKAFVLDQREQIPPGLWREVGDFIEEKRASSAFESPGLAATAPVKALLTWPNNSASSSGSPVAAQSDEIKGRFAACRFGRWMDASYDFLAVPLSPSSSTVTSLAATSATSGGREHRFAVANQSPGSALWRRNAVRLVFRNDSLEFSAFSTKRGGAFQVDGLGK